MTHSSGSELLPVTSRGKRTREGLLRAAEAVFGAKGFERASIAEVTQLAGTAQGTFYLYFPDKQAVFIELVRELGRKLREHVHLRTAGCETRLEIERAGFRAFFEFCLEHRDLYRIVRQAEFVEESVYRDYYLSLGKAYAEGLARAMKAGEIRELDPERLAYALMAIADFYGMRWVLWDDAPDIDALVRDAMSIIEPALRAEGAPNRKRKEKR